MGSLLPIPQFRATFGAGLVGAQASLIQGMYTIGGVSALPFVGVLLDNFGRRFGMFIGSLSVIIGTVLGGTANHMDQLLASRFFLGMYKLPPSHDLKMVFLDNFADRNLQALDTRSLHLPRPHTWLK